MTIILYGWMIVLLSTLPLLERFEVTIHLLKRAVADAYPLRTMTGMLIHLIYNRLARFNTEFQKLAAEIRAGKIRPELARRRHAAREPDELFDPPDPADPATPPKLRIPQGLGWLIRRVPHVAAVHAGYMRVMLRDPEMMEMLAVSGRLRALLRPLCKALMVEPEYLVPQPAAAVVAEEAPVDIVSPDASSEPMEQPSSTFGEGRGGGERPLRTGAGSDGSPSPSSTQGWEEESDGGSLGNFNSLDAAFLGIAVFNGPPPAADRRTDDPPSGGIFAPA